LDDIGHLTALWESMHLGVDNLAKRVTEFQVAEGKDGQVLGAIGLQIAERQGLIHSEGFNDFSLADHLRPLLWERIQSIGTNHGLLRLWTEERAPFWTHSGLSKPDAETLERLPGAWRRPSADWLTLKLKEDLSEVISADKEFALFMETEKQRTARAFRQARVLKGVATLIAVVVMMLVLAGAFLLLRKNPQLLHR